ncbi:Crp/Fnr family transcriptional regulator [Rubrolithibacter danxiaensis]|uniref:Crp/Fnr family transcriptional regulator n=1 Tax=Rubrolithibacter danxiaensis TaxID=3390805 RepID=UPI003BF84658
MKIVTERQLEIYRAFLTRYVTFTEEEWAIFQSFLQLKSIKKKENFVETGKVCTEVGFILEGSVRIYHIKDGQEITGYFCLENELISSYKSFLNQNPSNCYIEALENTEIIIFSKNALGQLLNNPLINYKMERFGRLVAEELLCCYDDRVFSFVTQTPEERYLQLLQYGRNILKRIPQHYIANYLGITPVSLSRIRKRILEPASGLLVNGALE